MLWKDLMDKRIVNIESDIIVKENEDVMDLILGDYESNSFYIQVVNDRGECVGSVRREIVEIVHGNMAVLNLQHALDNVADGVIIINENGRIVYINPAYTKILGVTPWKVVGKYIQQVEPQSALRNILYKPHRPVVEHDRLIESIKKHVSIRISPIIRNGEFCGAVSIFNDITQLNALSEEVRRVSEIAQDYGRQINRNKSINRDHIIGESKAFKNCLERAMLAAPTDAPMLIVGDSGVGKEVMVRLIHSSSLRKDQPLIEVNCSAIPEALIESELFGNYSNKDNPVYGKLHLANGGTLFLDDIAELPMDVQMKLFNALQSSQITGPDGNPVDIDIRLIATSEKPLEEYVDSGEFRQDLFYHINVVNVKIPSLKERGNDVVLLAEYFFNYYMKKYNKKIEIDDSVKQVFLNYSWPGNIRELSAAIQRIVVLSNKKTIYASDLKNIISAYKIKNPARPSNIDYKVSLTLKDAADAFERDYINEALKYHDGDLDKAMQALGISKRTFYRKIKSDN